jgi:glycosyltransferase involved in cell wall biosynthesis
MNTLHSPFRDLLNTVMAKFSVQRILSICLQNKKGTLYPILDRGLSNFLVDLILNERLNYCVTCVPQRLDTFIPIILALRILNVSIKSQGTKAYGFITDNCFLNKDDCSDDYFQACLAIYPNLISIDKHSLMQFLKDFFMPNEFNIFDIRSTPLENRDQQYNGKDHGLDFLLMDCATNDVLEMLKDNLYAVRPGGYIMLININLKSFTDLCPFIDLWGDRLYTYQNYFLNNKSFAIWKRNTQLPINPKLSLLPPLAIVMATYERGCSSTPFLLKRALESVVAQTYENWILYLVMDQVTADFENVIKELSLIVPAQKIHIFHNAISERSWINDKSLLWRVGGANALNMGLHYARQNKHKYYVHLDDDDYWNKNHLWVLANTYHVFPKAIFVYTRSIYASAERPYLPKENIEFIYGSNLLPKSSNVVHSAISFDMDVVKLDYNNSPNPLPGDALLINQIKELQHKYSKEFKSRLEMIYVPCTTVMHKYETFKNSNPFKYMISLVCETPTIDVNFLRWIQYHKQKGVDHFYVLYTSKVQPDELEKEKLRKFGTIVSYEELSSDNKIIVGDVVTAIKKICSTFAPQSMFIGYIHSDTGLGGQFSLQDLVKQYQNIGGIFFDDEPIPDGQFIFNTQFFTGWAADKPQSKRPLYRMKDLRPMMPSENTTYL